MRDNEGELELTVKRRFGSAYMCVCIFFYDVLLKQCVCECIVGGLQGRRWGVFCRGPAANTATSFAWSTWTGQDGNPPFL